MQSLKARVLTIAGSDSGGGAGIQADIKTCTALGCYAMTAITAITAQNTREVRAVFDIPPEHIRAQIAAVCEDIGVDAVKTGMLSNVATIEVVAQGLKQYKPGLFVLDPVMISKSGAVLLHSDAIQALKKQLIPMATLVCPNVPEAEALVGIPLRDDRDIETVLKSLYALGARNILLKGGHLKSAMATDYLYDGNEIQTFAAPRIATAHTHGTGCTYSAAIACFLALRSPLVEAIGLAKNYLTGAIMGGENLQLGHGVGPLHHCWNIKISQEKAGTGPNAV